MNYEKLYFKFIDYCKSTPIEERLKKRDPFDLRLSKKIYKEHHHVTPIHDGGTDDDMVYLSIEEHIFAHKIRWKAYKQRGDMLAVRFCLNGLNNDKNCLISENKIQITKKIKQTLIWVKQNSYEVRTTHGWQSEEGRRKISESRKGTMPVKCAITGEMIGSVPINHPNVINGEWVHHTKGRKQTEEERLSKSQPGELNNNFNSIITKDYLIEFLFNNIDYCIDENMFIKKKFISLLKEEMQKYSKKVSEVVVTNRFVTIENMINEYNLRYKSNISYNPYFRSVSQRKQIASHFNGKTKQEIKENAKNRIPI